MHSDQGSESEEEGLSRDKVLDRYITQAKAKRAMLTTKRKQHESLPTDQIQITVGRMTYNRKKKKAIPDRDFGTRKVFFYKEATFARVLERCKHAVFPDAPEAEYYISDSTGIPIEGDQLALDRPDGKDKEIKWSLGTYLRVSGVRYQSRARINCVQTFEEEDEDDERDGHSSESDERSSGMSSRGRGSTRKRGTGQSSRGRGSSGGRGTGQSNEGRGSSGGGGTRQSSRGRGSSGGRGTGQSNEGRGSSGGRGTGQSGEGRDSSGGRGTGQSGEGRGSNEERGSEQPNEGRGSNEEGGSGQSNVGRGSNEGRGSGQSSGKGLLKLGPPPLVPVREDVPMDMDVAEIEPLFVVVKQSLYADKYSATTDLSQESAMGFHLQDDPATMHAVQEKIMTQNDPSKAMLLPSNPCFNGFIFQGFKRGEEYVHVADVDDSGRVTFTSPKEGAVPSLVTHSLAQRDVAMLLCVEENGFHGQLTYEWYRDGELMHGETFPVKYTQAPGLYTCRVTGQLSGRDSCYSKQVAFSVECDDDNLVVRKTQQCDSDDSKSQQSEAAATNLFGENGLDLDAFNEQDFSESSELRLVNVIGQGSFGIVHRAIWRGSVVAAKVVSLPSASRAAILKEVDTFRSVQHPNILCFMGTVVSTNAIAIITNLVKGRDLHTLIFDKSSARMDFNTKLFIAIQIGQALTFLHSGTPPTVHLDIKPANILVDDHSTRTFLADFGLARVITCSQALGTKTMQSGTPGFQAPEQLRNERVDEKADVYAMGAVLTELFGEKPVWPPLTSYQIMYRVGVEGEFPTYAHLPQPIQNVCGMCLTNKASRAPSMTVLKALCEVAKKQM